ncbi:MAG: hypothetical protein ACKVVP_21020, partial [Chloroflexota bacterium]
LADRAQVGVHPADPDASQAQWDRQRATNRDWHMHLIPAALANGRFSKRHDGAERFSWMLQIRCRGWSSQHPCEVATALENAVRALDVLSAQLYQRLIQERGM